ncbi:hypothetical protein L596_008561 [Steinernema carpocapsae]|uniref:Secreted protein n=1 Tax=Steinernema carpocapsae TaxID=34508 RepID=A0A4U5PD51_STECR|nr:hypothetical protein L596_008561 [Steinernema carpocapsae]
MRYTTSLLLLFVFRSFFFFDCRLVNSPFGVEWLFIGGNRIARITPKIPANRSTVSEGSAFSSSAVTIVSAALPCDWAATCKLVVCIRRLGRPP